MYCMSDLDEKILDICRNEYGYFLNKKNVMGVGLSYKIQNSFNTCKKCINVLVTKKVDESNLTCNDLVPKFYKGIHTDVQESGISGLYSFTSRIRPVRGGYDIGPASSEVDGSMGCLVTDGRYYYVLSNYHVIADQGAVPINTSIIQPSLLFGGCIKNDEIATLTKYISVVPLNNEDTVNYVDCAMAKITKRSQVSSKIALIGRIKGIGNPYLGQKVLKVGSETELTYGKVINIGATLKVSFRVGQCLFKNQIMTTAMSKEGDSGAILLDTNMKAIGLLMGHIGSYTVFNSIQDVLKELNVRIVTG